MSPYGPRFPAGVLPAALTATLLGAAPGGLASPPAPHRIARISEAGARRPAEVAVAISPADPTHVIAVATGRGAPGEPRSTNASYVSFDGGETWKTVPAANPDRRVQGDDTIVFSADGTAHHVYIAFDGIRVPRPDRAVSGIFARRTRDGLVWSDPVPVVDHVNSTQPFEDKPGPGADTAAGSPHRGNLYVAWTRFDAYGSKDPADKSHIVFARSRDGGRTFSVPIRVSDTPGDAQDSDGTVEGAVPAVGPEGEVYLAWAGPRGIVFDCSRDGGYSFGEDRVIAQNPGGWDLPVPGVPRHNGLPVTSTDLSPGPDRGSVYVTWIDERNGDPDVFVIASRDGGATWGEPVRVNDDPKGNGKAQLFAWTAVDPADGSVNTVFYDRRGLEGTATGLTLARSVDGGRTFVNHRVAQKPFACRDEVFLGDYIGLAARGGRVVAAYAHLLDETETALSAAVFRFKPGTQGLEPTAPDAPATPAGR
ncbi:MAG TPA: sialidase family protein [Vicinamibacteria bacterium]|nr:sialidase family protein [Vicinamibacteria bacterium]